MLVIDVQQGSQYVQCNPLHPPASNAGISKDRKKRQTRFIDKLQPPVKDLQTQKSKNTKDASVTFTSTSSPQLANWLGHTCKRVWNNYESTTQLAVVIISNVLVTRCYSLTCRAITLSDPQKLQSCKEKNKRKAECCIRETCVEITDLL